MSQDKLAAFHDLSADLKTEFYTSFKEAIEELDSCFGSLNEAYSEECIHRLFRAVHTVKGNCHLVFLNGIADVCHQLEDIASQLRKGESTYSPAQGEFFTFVFARLEQLLSALMRQETLAADDTAVLSRGIGLVMAAPLDQRDQVIQQTLQSFSGLLSSSESISEKVMLRLQLQGQSQISQSQMTPPTGNESQQQPQQQLQRQSQERLQSVTDFDPLGFMDKIGSIIQSQSVQHKGDRNTLLALGLKVNQALPNPVVSEQFAAAFHLQYLGSRFVSSPVHELEVDGKRWEIDKVREQLDIAAGFLKLNGVWPEAVMMIEQSYERFDGRGLNGLQGAEIHPGAMLLSALRCYQRSFFKQQRGLSSKKVVARALSQLNSESGGWFDPQLISLFNRLIKDEYSLALL